MSTPTVGRILSVPGRLSHTPTSLATAYPHGGTALGTCGRVSLRPYTYAMPITAEEFGGVPSDFLYGGEGWVLEATLREIDDLDALSILFPIYVAGAAGGPILRANAYSGVRAGTYLGDLAKVIVFTPDNPDDHQWLIVRRAVPLIDETAMLAFRANEDLGIPVMWSCTPDSVGRQIEYGKRRDITL